jgi:hypothetical protein
MKSNIPDPQEKEPELTIIEKKADKYIEIVEPKQTAEQKESTKLAFIAGAQMIYSAIDTALEASPEETLKLFKAIGSDLARYRMKVAFTVIIAALSK